MTAKLKYRLTVDVVCKAEDMRSVVAGFYQQAMNEITANPDRDRVDVSLMYDIPGKPAVFAGKFNLVKIDRVSTVDAPRQ